GASRREVVVVFAEVATAEVVSAAESVVPAAEVITDTLSVALARAHGGGRRDQAAQRGLAAVGAWRIGRGIAHQQRRRSLATLLAPVLIDRHAYDYRDIDFYRSSPRGD